ncbi:MAG: hypothetical protein V4717_21130 [Bacteroidota bacterium]
MNENTFTVNENKLLLNGQVFVILDENIQDFITTDDSIVILVNADISQNDRNVYCYNFDGKLRWRILPLDKLHFQNYYTSVYLSDEDLLQAYNINGVEVTLDKRDGNFIKKELIK